MIKHIVLWKFKEDKKDEMNLFLKRLEELNGVITEIKCMEIKRNVNLNGKNFDAMLISGFDSIEDMEKYKVDPRHVEVANLCKEIRIDRAAIDYEE